MCQTPYRLKIKKLEEKVLQLFLSLNKFRITGFCGITFLSTISPCLRASVFFVFKRRRHIPKTAKLAN